jgi:hypothetical protein
LDNAIFSLLDRIRGADFGTCGTVAVHADGRNSCGGPVPVNEIDMDHRIAAMGFAFGTSIDAGFTPDAPRGIDEKTVWNY